MARILIVGCGCRGRALGAELQAAGHAVRGTTRTEEGKAAIEQAGIEAVVADPDRLGTLMMQIEGVAVVCWLMGSAEGEPEAVAALHGPRLETMLEKLVDTHVRGVVYEAAGPVAGEVLCKGAGLVLRAGETWSMPVEVVSADLREHDAWVAAMSAAVDRVLAA